MMVCMTEKVLTKWKIIYIYCSSMTANLLIANLLGSAKKCLEHDINNLELTFLVKSQILVLW